MALINNLYVFVQDESISQTVESTSHPVEKGVDLTDHVRLKPWVLTLKGKLVGKNVTDTLAKLKTMQKNGTIVTYKGRRTYSGGQIITLNRSSPSTNWGGIDIDITIQQVRIGKPSYAKKSAANKTTGTQQVTSKSGKKKRYHTVKAGESRWSIAQKYKPHGCTIEYLTKHNNNTKCLLQVGNWYTLKVGAKMLVGEW